MGKVSTQLGSKQSYPSTRQSYSSSRKGIGGRKRKKQDATPKTSSTYFDKLLQKQTGLFYFFSTSVHKFPKKNFEI